MTLKILAFTAFFAFPILLIRIMTMLATIKASVTRLSAVILRLHELIAVKDARIAELQAEIDALRLEFAEVPAVEVELDGAVVALEALAPAA